MDDPTCGSDDCTSAVYALDRCQRCYQREYARQWRTENRDRANASRREHYAKNSAENLAKQKAYRERLKAEGRGRAWTEHQRRTQMLSRYGVTPDERDALLASQGSTCAICRTDAPTGGWVIDHDHETGAVRGILCRRCNSGIGQLGDDPLRVAAALNYLTTTEGKPMNATTNPPKAPPA